MVDHNHDRIEVVDGEEVGDEVHGQVLERMGFFKSKGGDGGDGWIDKHLVCLADCTPGNDFQM